MFGIFSEEKKREKKAKWAVALCHEYTDTCISVICQITSVMRATEEQKNQGGDLNDHIVPRQRLWH
jgi:hypothetical protein|tara:strand:- start:39 stop:236 length:198 start_codon:yes stop_codon:yes gene_type:complete